MWSINLKRIVPTTRDLCEYETVSKQRLFSFVPKRAVRNWLHLITVSVDTSTLFSHVSAANQSSRPLLNAQGVLSIRPGTACWRLRGTNRRFAKKWTVQKRGIVRTHGPSGFTLVLRLTKINKVLRQDTERLEQDCAA